jgi:hypothetical protein
VRLKTDASVDLSEYKRFPIEYEDADLRHYFGVVQNRLGDWVVLADFAGWCLPLQMITSWRTDPVSDACFHLISRLIRPLMWMGLLEHKPNHDRMRIEQRHCRKTNLFDRIMRIAFLVGCAEQRSPRTVLTMMNADMVRAYHRRCRTGLNG